MSTSNAPGGLVSLANGAELYVEDHGSGQPLILIPGWAYSARVFERNVPSLSKSYRVVTYDPRGHGRSPAVTDGHDYRTHGQDLHALIEHLQLEQVVLAGWSLGVYDALSYIDQFGSERVSKLIAIDESPSILKVNPDQWGEGSAEEIAGLIAVVESEEYLPFFADYMRGGFVGDAPKDLVSEFTILASSLSSRQAASLLTDALSYDFQSLLRTLNALMPVLHIVREDWSEAAKRWVAENQPSAEFEVLGGHLMCLEFADEFNDRIRRFIEGSTY